MGKITGCVVHPEQTGTNGVYRPGQVVAGSATLTVDGEVKVRGVNITFIGMALTKWKPPVGNSFSNDVKSTEVYIKHEIRHQVLSLTTGGDNRFIYSFQLPYDGLPSSYEGFYGAVRYCLRVEVDKPFPGINDVFNNCFTVLAHLDANEPQFLRGCSVNGDKILSKFLGFGTAGRVHLTATLDRSGYCPGETILINLEARNESSKDCGAVKATLVQHVHFKASYSKQTSVAGIRTIMDRSLNKGETRSWQRMKFLVDPVPPTTKPSTCQIIQVNYSLKIALEVPFGFDLELNIPITICTVPLGKSLAHHSNPCQPDFSESVGQNTLTYTQCTCGTSVFPKGDTDFPYSSYRPMTAFVSTN